MCVGKLGSKHQIGCFCNVNLGKARSLIWENAPSG